MDAVLDSAEQDSAEMRQKIDGTRSAMADKLEALEDRMIDTVHSAQDTVASVKRAFDIKHQIEQRPWTLVGGCFLGGLALGLLITKRRPRGKTPGNSSGPAAPTFRLQAALLSRPGVFDRFQGEIDKVKGMAIGYVMGLARDSIKEAVPQMASQIDDVMNGVTMKMGGEPVRQQST